ncbi:MAG: hypothetical protein QNK36_10545 [Colwellia sp.]|nr:hypothetical protein [Colwellia sp.]
MTKPIFNAKKAYKKIAKGGTKYEEETHCVLILKIFNTEGSVATFCKAANIGDSTFWDWTRRHPIFDKCHRLAVMIANSNWEEEGKKNKDNPEFNSEHWKITGSSRFNLGKTARIRLGVDYKSDPYTMFQHLTKQATEGDFTATEYKLLMESIGAGTRAFESFKLQVELDTIKKDLEKMGRHNADNIIPIESVTKTG